MKTQTVYASTDRHDEWEGPKRYVCIVIHDTAEQLQEAARKHSPGRGWEGVVGCFHPVTEREIYDKKTKKWVDTTPKHFAGIIRLCRDRVNDEVIVHEVVHAAAHIFRLGVTKRLNLGDNCYRNEEWFAYIVGNLSGVAIKVVSELLV